MIIGKLFGLIWARLHSIKMAKMPFYLLESGSSRLRVHCGASLRFALIAIALTLHIPRATSL